MQNRMRLEQLQRLLAVPVVPVLTIERVEDALPLARALADGGLTTLEVTLRTPTALSAINMIAEALGNVAVGVGTVRSPEQAAAAMWFAARYASQPDLVFEYYSPQRVHSLEARMRWVEPDLRPLDSAESPGPDTVGTA